MDNAAPDTRPGPSLAAIEAAAAQLRGRIVRTPTVDLLADALAPYLPEGAVAALKLELFQHAGSFKARGALLSVDALSEAERARGVTAVSGGNHALATAWAARQGGVSAKVVMPKAADPVRIEGSRALGAQVVLTDDIHAAFAEVDRIVAEEGRVSVHPFEGEARTLGTATCGLEFLADRPDLEALVVPVGGGGLISGMARAAKLVAPHCAVYGVEPFGADSLYRSFEAGSPVSIPKVETIADSLGSPTALPYSFAVARAHVDAIVRIRDEEMLRAMVLLYDGLKLAAEPACAAATAALIGPLRERLKGKRVGVIACGSNIGEERFAAFLAKGRELLASAQ